MSRRAALALAAIASTFAGAASADTLVVRAGRLVRVPGLDDVLVPLYWQAATLPVTRLVRLTRAVREAAQRTLERG